MSLSKVAILPRLLLDKGQLALRIARGLGSLLSNGQSRPSRGLRLAGRRASQPCPFDDDRLDPAATQEISDRGADDAATAYRLALVACEPSCVTACYFFLPRSAILPWRSFSTNTE